MVAAVANQRSLCQRLFRLTANARDPQHKFTALPSGASNFLGGQLQNGLEKTHFRIPNGELRRVYAHGQATRSRGEIIAEQRPLPALVQFARGVKGERAGGDDQSALERLTNCGVDLAVLSHASRLLRAGRTRMSALRLTLARNWSADIPVRFFARHRLVQ